MVRLTDRPDMTLDVYHGRKTTIQQQSINAMIVLKLTDKYRQMMVVFSGDNVMKLSK